MTAKEQKTPEYLAAFESLERESPSWLAERRRLALERFSLLGFPTTRDEEYKYTNLAPIARLSLKAAAPTAAGAAPDFPQVDYAGEEAARLVLLDGRAISAPTRGAGFEVVSLKEQLAAEPGALEGWLTRFADVEADALAALNTALFEDGAFVRVSEKAVVERPIHIVHVSTGRAEAAIQSRTLILAGRQAEASIIESFISLADGASWTNSVTEIVAEEAARIEHFKAQQESFAGYHTGVVEALTERNAYVSTISLSFGAALARNDVNVKLNGEGGECAIDGLYVVGGRQHVDHHTLIDHAAPRCNSHQLYKGVLDGESRGVFNGKIIVRKGAQKTDAIQNNKNLLLSRKAEIDTKPQLEIDADDVRCTHGATVGQLDVDALFYLRSRGIGEDAARGLLTYAFAAELLERVKIEPLRRHFEHMLMRSLSKDPEAEETIQ